MTLGLMIGGIEASRVTLVVVQPNRHDTAIENLCEKIDMVTLAWLYFSRSLILTQPCQRPKSSPQVIVSAK